MLMEPLLYSIAEIPALTRLGRSIIYREIAEGRLETVKVGRRRLVPRAALEDYVESLRGSAAAEERRP